MCETDEPLLKIQEMLKLFCTHAAIVAVRRAGCCRWFANSCRSFALDRRSKNTTPVDSLTQIANQSPAGNGQESPPQAVMPGGGFDFEPAIRHRQRALAAREARAHVTPGGQARQPDAQTVVDEQTSSRQAARRYGWQPDGRREESGLGHGLPPAPTDDREAEAPTIRRAGRAGTAIPARTPIHLETIEKPA